MNIAELSTEIKQAVYSRQNGMCAFTGKKFEEFNDNIDADFVLIDSSDTSNNTENIIMLWKQHGLSSNTKLRKYLLTYANFSDYGSETKLNDFKEDIAEINGRASIDTDIRGLYNSINDLTNNIKLLGVSASQRGELKDQLHAVLSIVRQRQSEIKENDKKD